MKKKITEYSLVVQSSGKALVNEVNKCLNLGWEPYGDVVVNINTITGRDRLGAKTTNYDSVFTQAMVKREE